MVDKEIGEKKIQILSGEYCKICTCGHSNDLPLCDNEHRKINEKDGSNFKSLKIKSDSDIEISVFSKIWIK